MADQHYAFKDYNKETMARVLGKSLPVSTKESVLICNALRYKPVTRALALLQNVIDKKEAIPYTRFNRDTAHRPGKMAAGRYPEKACGEILSLMKSAVANAQFKGFNTELLEVIHVCAHRASRPFRFGRQSRRQMKRTHIEIVIAEGAKKQLQKKKEAKL
ncbi:50S ribosomal protein L22 [Candidatus Woesearchaeota archaeon]|nr:50S ribosomal protein L22 [Candidatus Woesearchaeota archaeon]